MADVLRAEGLELRRGERRVLCGAAVRVTAGEVTALLGPSGAGKSSLLRCFVRLEAPEAGTIALGGEDVRGLDPRVLRRRVGLVPEAPAMLPGTVEDNLIYGLEAPLAPELAESVLRDAGLRPDLLRRDARSLSGGETMRVALARALARQPEALLLDEPTAALDPPVAAALERVLARLADEGLAVVLATHDRALAARLASHAVLVQDGGTPASGTVEEVLAAWRER